MCRTEQIDPGTVVDRGPAFPFVGRAGPEVSPGMPYAVGPGSRAEPEKLTVWVPAGFEVVIRRVGG
jgi:hypothetical protein